MSSYKKAHIYFLQAIMNRGIISSTECSNICQSCFQITEERYDGSLQEFINVINHQLQPFHFEIRECKREDTGEAVFVLVSMAEHDLNYLVTNGDFSRLEMDFFRHVVDLIVHADHTENPGMASSIDVLNLADSLNPKMSKVDTKKLLSRLVDDEWFYDKNGMISMSPRAILELEHYFAEEYEGFIKTCPLCDMTVFEGQSCGSCPVRVHNLCATHFFKSSWNCVSCNNAWPRKYKQNNVVVD